MANPDHLELLSSGVAKWNSWREADRDAVPDLREAALSGAALSGADLSKGKLSSAVLLGTNLSGTYFRNAILIGADLKRSHPATPTSEMQSSAKPT
jgi:hypothetical protein